MFDEPILTSFNHMILFEQFYEWENSAICQYHLASKNASASFRTLELDNKPRFQKTHLQRGGSSLNHQIWEGLSLLWIIALLKYYNPCTHYDV